jgi:hypothetical protein
MNLKEKDTPLMEQATISKLSYHHVVVWSMRCKNKINHLYLDE